MVEHSPSPAARVGAFTVAALLATAAIGAWCLGPRISATDTDMFWHLASGRVIVEAGALPSHDPFSFTSDVPWLDAEWAYDVATYLVWRGAGYDGLAALRITLVLLNACLVALLVRRRLPAGEASSVLAWGLAALSLLAMRPYFLLRPHVVGCTLLLVFLGGWLEVLDGRWTSRRFVSFCIPLMIVWANVHATCIVGLGILGLSAVGRGLMERRGAEPRCARTLLAGLVASAAACCLTPYGPEAVLHPLYYLHENVFARSIAEMRPPDLLTSNPPWVALIFAVDAATCVALTLRRRWDLLGVVLLLSWQALRHDRHVALLTLYLMPLAAVAAAPLLSRLPSLRASRARGALAAAAVAGGVAACLMTWPRLLPLSRVWDWADHPIDAVSFIHDNDLPDALFNPFEWGGYLEWAAPRRKVFIDGRNEVAYSPQVYLEYLRILQKPEGRFERLDRFGIRTVLVNRRFEDLGLADALRGRAEWKEVYADDVAVIFVRGDAALLERLTQRPVLPQSPWTDARLGTAALQAGRLDDAERRLRRALEAQPYLTSARVPLGVVLMRTGRPGEAVAEWERAAADDPTLLLAHYSLGVYYAQAGDPDRAARELRAELRLQPDFAPARDALRRLQGGG